VLLPVAVTVTVTVTVALFLQLDVLLQCGEAAGVEMEVIGMGQTYPGLGLKVRDSGEGERRDRR
jgi:hypothetical protein